MGGSESLENQLPLDIKVKLLFIGIMNAVGLAAEKVGGRARLADKLGVSQQTVSLWVRGRMRVTVERAVQIQGVTNGAVTVRELRPDLPADIFGPSPNADSAPAADPPGSASAAA